MPELKESTSLTTCFVDMKTALWNFIAPHRNEEAPTSFGRKVARVAKGIFKTFVVIGAGVVGLAIAPLGVVCGIGYTLSLLCRNVKEAYNTEKVLEVKDRYAKRFISGILSAFIVKLPIDLITGTVCGVLDMILLPIETLVNTKKMFLLDHNEKLELIRE